MLPLSPEAAVLTLFRTGSPETLGLGGLVQRMGGDDDVCFAEAEEEKPYSHINTTCPLYCSRQEARNVTANAIREADMWWMCVQGYLARKKQPPRGSLQQPYASGPMTILGGWVLLMSEVLLEAAVEQIWHILALPFRFGS